MIHTWGAMVSQANCPRDLHGAMELIRLVGCGRDVPNYGIPCAWWHGLSCGWVGLGCAGSVLGGGAGGRLGGGAWGGRGSGPALGGAVGSATHPPRHGEGRFGPGRGPRRHAGGRCECAHSAADQPAPQRLVEWPSGRQTKGRESTMSRSPARLPHRQPAVAPLPPWSPSTPSPWHPEEATPKASEAVEG